jgi:hypothetical protein
LEAVETRRNGAILCAKINQNGEVYMILDKDVAFMAIKWMPELEPFKR